LEAILDHIKLDCSKSHVPHRVLGRSENNTTRLHSSGDYFTKTMSLYGISINQKTQEAFKKVTTRE